jgi:phospholipid/cholesterol/gamma-HCH transport system permease protein
VKAASRSRNGAAGMLRFLAVIGAPVIASCLWLIRLAALGTAVIVHAPRAAIWRRTVRSEFKRALDKVLVGGLVPVLVTAMLVGLGLIYQALYWLEAAGQIDFLGRIIVVILVRELGPILVGLVVLGQSGSATLIEITQMRTQGPVRMLDGQGVDPFLFLVVPRSLAFTLGVATLTTLFVTTTLITGYLAASGLGYVKLSLWGFLDVVTRAMRFEDFMLLIVKPIAIGFIIGLVCCMTALLPGRDVTRVVAIGFIRAALAVLAISGLVSLML